MKLQIVNWREFNDDEAYCRIEVLPDGVDLLDIIESEHTQEERETWVQATGETKSHCFFVNDDITIFDGQQMIDIDGKRYVIRIEEVPDVAQPQ